jgi:transposase
LNDLSLILNVLEPFRGELFGIAVESTYNWYWLVDGLMEAGYGQLHLANPSAIKQYEGLKHTDDRHSAFWLAHLLALGILPEGYIYPKEDRAVRDLLRKRSFLVRHRTAHILSLQTMIERQKGRSIGSNQIKRLKAGDMEELFEQDHLVLSATASGETIAFLGHQIHQIEKALIGAIKIRKPFELLLTVPGVGQILALTIMLEVGEIGRFPGVGNFCSYARCVPAQRFSAGKSTGKGNRKNGNRYLGWAFVEASHFARRHNAQIQRYYQRKASKTNPIVATKALSNKLARACYYILRDGVGFREQGFWC